MRKPKCHLLCLLKMHSAKHRSVHDAGYHGCHLVVRLTFVCSQAGQTNMCGAFAHDPIEAGHHQQVFLETLIGGFVKAMLGEGGGAQVADGGRHLQYSRSGSSSRRGSWKDKRSCLIFHFSFLKNTESAIRTGSLKCFGCHVNCLAYDLIPTPAPHPSPIFWQWRCGEGKWPSSGIWAPGQHVWNFQTSRLMTADGTASM